jgi:hypothetical protein
VRFLEEQLRLERDAHGEARRIIAGLVQRVPELEAPQDPPPATPDAPRARTNAAAPPDGGDVPPEQKRAQAGAQPWPWWQRVFGG